MTGNFVWNLTAFMKEMSSVERIQEYSECKEQEASWDEGMAVSESWP
jgi:hypothetical protein